MIIECWVGTTASSLSPTLLSHTLIHYLISPIFLVITHTFNSFLTHCLLPLHSLNFYNHPHPASLWLTSYPLLLSHPFTILPLLARVARQCSNAICQRSMSTVFVSTHTHATWQGHLPVQYIPISMLPPPDHHSPMRCVTHALTLCYWVTCFICLPTGGAGEHLPEQRQELGTRGGSCSKQIITAVTYCLIIDKQEKDDHMGVYST